MAESYRLPGGWSLPPFSMYQVLALVIVGIALWVLGLLWVGLDVGERWVLAWQKDIRFHVYLDQGQDPRPLAERLMQLDDVDTVTTIDPEQSVRWAEEWLGGLGDIAKELAEELPLTLEIIPVDTPSRFIFKDIRDEAVRSGARVNENESLLMDANAWLERIRTVLFVLAFVLALPVTIIIANVLRMSLLARESEIHLMRLMGAKEWFIRLPFVLEGVLIGGFSGILAWCLLWPMVLLAQSWLPQMIQQVSLASFIPLLLGLGGVSGCFGALIATGSVKSPDDMV